MEPHLGPRSASYSSLHSTHSYATSRTNSGYQSYTTPRRRPLRSVNENVSFLRSPGPLESMLKTTTETGDIGIFSINLPPQAATFHQPLRPRPSLENRGPVPRSHTGGYDRGSSFDDRRWLPSYRDATSEIISLYETDTQPSNSRPYSPVLDGSRRSCSITTCSSRNMPSHASCGTFQSSGHEAPMQRPRSPFPYPTRLKRPGVRPSSPALTESGDIDYSRMVEVDRVSQRTVHRSYRHMHNTSFRRPLPLSLRSDTSSSSISLPVGASPMAIHPAHAQMQGRTPNYSLPHTSRQYPRYRPDASVDPSQRSASLTSIVEMYHRPFHDEEAETAARSSGSFYYDYSEGFEDLPPELPDQAPLCPIPQRAGSNTRPLILSDETQLSLDIEASTSSTTEPQIQEGEDGGAYSTDTTSYIETQRQGDRRMRRSFSSPAPRLTYRHSQEQRYTQTDTDSQASDQHDIRVSARMPEADTEFPKMMTSQAFRSYSAREQSIIESQAYRGNTERYPTIDPEAVAAYGKGHRRNIAIMELNRPEARGIFDQMSSCSMNEEMETSTYESSSPHRSQKRRSDPHQLMKTLPPLPHSNGQACNEAIETFPSEPVEYSRFQQRRSPPATSNYGSEDDVQGNDSFHDTSAVEKRDFKADGPPKFRVRVKGPGQHVRSSVTGMNTNQTELDEQAVTPADPQALGRTKFRLRTSRSQIETRQLRRNSIVSHSTTPSNAASSTKRMSHDDVRSNIEATESPTEAGSADRVALLADQQETGNNRVQDVSDQFDILCPPSPVIMEASRASKCSTRTLIGKESHTSGSDETHDVHIGLRKKMSQLRLRITRRDTTASQRHANRRTVSSVRHATISSISEVPLAPNEKKKRSGVLKRPNKVSRRVRRWASDARKVMRLYVRRSGSSPSTVNN
ncbi:hypothetical protein B0I35DRAFT_27411 [Stachybotrys elegans]|uniref:Uncharacterized protein n=1 Tax=Stachybotrys elegans TaxID=80388 RepID=A0A8K0T652_9HYPO|nr:hypothetical protein B0I35DRAFT_27411 [Stachybotrys elegans]